MEINKKINLEEIGERFHLDFIVLFGSKATKFNSHGSDVDIAFKVVPDREIDENGMLSMEEALSARFPDRELDLVPMGPDTSPLLMKEIADNGVILFERKEDLFAEWGWRVAKHYDDYRFISRHLFDEMRNETPYR